MVAAALALLSLEQCWQRGRVTRSRVTQSHSPFSTQVSCELRPVGRASFSSPHQQHHHDYIFLLTRMVSRSLVLALLALAVVGQSPVTSHSTHWLRLPFPAAATAAPLGLHTSISISIISISCTCKPSLVTSCIILHPFCPLHPATLNDQRLSEKQVFVFDLHQSHSHRLNHQLPFSMVVVQCHCQRHR